MRARERSKRDIKPYENLTYKDYYKEQSRLYPPDGYTNHSKRINIGGGKRRRITEDNRPWPAEYKQDQKSYEISKIHSLEANSDYRRQVDFYMAAEKEIRLMHEEEKLKAVKVDRGGLYSPIHHKALQKSADLREEIAYKFGTLLGFDWLLGLTRNRYATERMDVYEKWLRINRKPQTDISHYDAQEITWDEHQQALDDLNKHYRII